MSTPFVSFVALYLNLFRCSSILNVDSRSTFSITSHDHNQRMFMRMKLCFSLLGPFLLGVGTLTSIARPGCWSSINHSLRFGVGTEKESKLVKSERIGCSGFGPLTSRSVVRLANHCAKGSQLDSSRSPPGRQSVLLTTVPRDHSWTRTAHLPVRCPSR